jgi:HD-GYP domain-containing protein (c-di-GMP phosphodiesterase class II)
VDVATLQESCRGVMRTSESGAGRLLRMLEWMRDDLIAKARDSVAIAEFSTQLSEMYEEIGLLYRVGRSMNRVTQPEDFVRETCHDLARTLPFGWVALKFMPSVRVAIGLSGRLFVAGKPPCAPEELDTLLFETMLDLPSDRWALLTPEDNRRLALRVKSQVLAHPVTREEQVIGALFAGNKNEADPHVSSFETQLLDAAADYMGVFIENAALYSDQHSLFLGMVEALTASIDAKDRYTCGHSERVGLMASALARAMGMKPEEAERVRVAGLLHDVGKIGVPEAVLTKPGRLTEAEFEQMKRHPAIGYRILRDMPSLEDILPGVLHHHERWDGRGYPDGLAGEKIPHIARLLGVADAFDAMSSTRSYRAAMPRQKVLSEVLRCAGEQFDPEMARAFVQLDLSEYDRLTSRHMDRDREARAA